MIQPRFMLGPLSCQLRPQLLRQLLPDHLWQGLQPYYNPTGIALGNCGCQPHSLPNLIRQCGATELHNHWINLEHVEKPKLQLPTVAVARPL